MRRPWLIAAAVIVAVWWLNDTSDPRALFWDRYRFRHVMMNLCVTWFAICAAYVFASSSGRPTRAARTALLTTVVAACASAGEVPALWFGYDYREPLGTWSDESWFQRSIALNRPDAELIHLHRPRSAWTGTVRGNLSHLGIQDPQTHAVDVRYDRNGFRNATELHAADLAVIGDSFVEAALVPARQTLTGLLETRTGKAVANLGQAGYGPQQELIVLRRFALPLRPKTVIWCLFEGNDLRDVTLYEEARSADPMTRRGSFAERSILRNVVLALSRAMNPERTPERTQWEWSATHAGTRTWFGHDNETWTEHQWQVLTRILEEAREACDAQGARFLVVHIPTKLSVLHGLLKDVGAAVSGSGPSPLPATLKSWCRANGIEFLDTTPALRAAAASGTAVYFADDGHWNPAGHEVAATAVLTRLSRTPR